MTTVELAVPGAHCGACRAEIIAALEAVPGVRAVEVDLRERRATVLFNPAVTAPTELCQRLGAAGYPGSTLVQAPPNPVG